jgi:glyoxalase family protein
MVQQFIPGIHHVTAIASNPQRNLDFYTRVLGLRPVKITVNFDSPGTYHFYFGDAQGSPGTIMTFFPWPTARRGRPGNGQVGVTAFSIPEGSVNYWRERLKQHGVNTSLPVRHFDEEALVLADPDGLRLELVPQPDGPETGPWEVGTVPGDYAIRGFHSVALWESEPKQTANVLTEVLGFEQIAESTNRCRFKTRGRGPGTIVDIIHRPDGSSGRGGAGTVQHVAWRSPNDAEQLEWRLKIRETGTQITEVKDRYYFRSVYFREPGGVLFEIATDQPGFTRDETIETLGSSLRLPSWLESQREQLERTLPNIQIPTVPHLHGQPCNL